MGMSIRSEKKLNANSLFSLHIQMPPPCIILFLKLAKKCDETLKYLLGNVEVNEELYSGNNS
jgi:hypothetical protein